jgi:hypothetical protein
MRHRMSTPWVIATILVLLAVLGGGVYLMQQALSHESVTAGVQQGGTAQSLPGPGADYSWQVVTGAPPQDLQQINTAIGAMLAQHPIQHLSSEAVSFEGVVVDGDWGVTGPVIRDKQSQTLRQGESVTILLHKENGSWKAAYPGAAEFISWLDAVPTTLISLDDKRQLR